MQGATICHWIYINLWITNVKRPSEGLMWVSRIPWDSRHDPRPMRLPVASLLLLVAACVPADASTPTSPTNPTVTTPATPVASSCAPATDFCDAGRIWMCTRSGSDASLLQVCSASEVCATTECPAGRAACCRRSKPACVAALTAPSTINATAYGTAPGADGSTCVALTGCNDFTVGWFGPPTAAACGTSSDYVYIRIPRPWVAAPPLNSVSVNYQGKAGSCAAWTGSISWQSDVPSWKVTLNLTCSETNKSGIKLIGVFSGDA
jgi:hypothetical protein